MRARVRVFDKDALTAVEFAERLKQLHKCQDSDIEILPDSDSPLDYISFGIQQLLTPRHLDVFFESGPLYDERLRALRRLILDQLESELDRAIMINEAKLTGE